MQRLFLGAICALLSAYGADAGQNGPFHTGQVIHAWQLNAIVGRRAFHDEQPLSAEDLNRAFRVRLFRDGDHLSAARLNKAVWLYRHRKHHQTH